MADKRLNNSLLARPERILFQRIVRVLPRSVQPSHLTFVAVFGGLTAGVSFILCNFSAIFLPIALGGIILNWFGDSVDGLLARVRSLRQRRHGFLFEHSCDLLAQSAMVIGLGFSPYLTLTSALMLLSLYLLMSSYTYLRITVEGVHRLSYAGLGATEFRVLAGDLADPCSAQRMASCRQPHPGHDRYRYGRGIFVTLHFFRFYHCHAPGSPTHRRA